MKLGELGEKTVDSKYLQVLENQLKNKPQIKNKKKGAGSLENSIIAGLNQLIYIY